MSSSSQNPAGGGSPDGRTVGIVGLGKMGGNLCLRAMDKGLRVVGKSRHAKPELENRGVKVTQDYGEFIERLQRPRTIFLYLPAGPVVDSVLDELVPHLDEGDIVLDGGNSFYRDSIAREQRLRDEGMFFMDCGTSGGPEGARKGPCFMVGGDPKAAQIVEPLLRSLAVNDQGFIYTGRPGSGHFVKLVHNGIEFGMLQAIGEGIEMLERSEFDLDLHKILVNWSNGSVVRGLLVELLARGTESRNLQDIEPYVEDTGEVNWLVQEAINKEIPIPVISQSIMELFKSRLLEKTSYKAIALMRHEFGGHPFGEDKGIAKERKTSRIAKI